MRAGTASSWTRLALALGAVVLVVGGAAAYAVTAPRPVIEEPSSAALPDGDAERGALVFAAGDCASCHASPGEIDRSRLGGGMALASPFGTFRPPNISPHPTDGIGRWSANDGARRPVRRRDAGAEPRLFPVKAKGRASAPPFRPNGPATAV